MDINLAKTFLEIMASGNFLKAAERLFITQSAVSLRVRKLEEELGQQVFVRTKSGVTLTSAGTQFERYARSMVKVWEDARYQISVPSGYESTLIVGAQYSLWPRLGFRWLAQLEKKLPLVAFRAELGMPDRLMRLMVDGVLDVGIMYTPQLRPGMQVETVIEDNLVLVSPDKDYPASLDERYMFLDWGPEFATAHQLQFPDFGVPRTTLSLGALAARYILTEKRAGYLPARIVREYVNRGRLHIVADAPAFPYPAYVAWNTEKEPELIEQALACLRQIAQAVDEQQHDLMDEAGVVEYQSQS